MAFWQENYAFIKEVFDKRTEKVTEVMDKADKAIAEVHADKIYTSEEFKRVKENFVNLAKNLETSEVTDWLKETKETLMGDRDAKSQGEENSKLNVVLDRYDGLLPKIAETKLLTDSLWKAYQYTDELNPHMEWLQEKKQLATRDINTNGAGETEEHIEKQEKVLDQLDKKRKVILELIAKGTKLKDDPKCPVFLAREVGNAKTLWEETNHLADERLNKLKDNLSAWERYEQKRDDLINKLDAAESELRDIKKMYGVKTGEVYDMTAGPEDHKNRVGVRAPYLRIGGNEQFNMMTDQFFAYDSSITAPLGRVPLWPYTLHFRMPHKCHGNHNNCPSRSHPIWEMPINELDRRDDPDFDENLTGCHLVSSCSNIYHKDQFRQLLQHNFERHYSTNKAPLSLSFDPSWLISNKGFADVVDEWVDHVLATYNDVYFVTELQVIQWMQNPTGTQSLRDFQEWKDKCAVKGQPFCSLPNPCPLTTRELPGETLRLHTCIECPKNYPWIQDPTGDGFSF